MAGIFVLKFPPWLLKPEVNVVGCLPSTWENGEQNRPFPSSKKSHFQSEAKCEAIDMKIIFNYDANKTYFHNKGFALTLVLKVRFFGTRKWPIRTGKFCPELVQIEGKTWNWNKRWLWRNGTRISVWNIPFRKTGVPFYILRCLLKFSAWSTLTFVFHIFFCWNKYLVLSWSFLLHFQGNNISLKFLHPWKEEKIGFGGKSSLSFGCVSKR